VVAGLGSFLYWLVAGPWAGMFLRPAAVVSCLFLTAPPVWLLSSMSTDNSRRSGVSNIVRYATVSSVCTAGGAGSCGLKLDAAIMINVRTAEIARFLLHVSCRPHK
jgi:hypothetical protein